MMRPLILALALACLATRAIAQQPDDTAYTRQIRALTSEPRFNTDLTNHLPSDARVPTPFAVLGYVPGTVGRLSRVADINRYFRALAAASDRIRVFSIGNSDEGREMIMAAIADPVTLASLNTFRDVTRRLADPRNLSEADARALIARGKPMYWLTGSLHSPETGSPEMLMELAYRLVVDEAPMYGTIREREIVLITPVLEVDGRDRMVDVYNYGRSHSGVRPPLVYWGRYTAHDNNRDAIVLSQVLTRNVLAAFFEWHMTVMHDLHESVPFLYTSTGTGPYNRAVDAITINEWYTL
ncbi:MAG: M14 family zinc carboxypeptidase, partial [Gemmatimonadota bacterium]